MVGPNKDCPINAGPIAFIKNTLLSRTIPANTTLVGHGGANTGWHAFLRVNQVVKLPALDQLDQHIYEFVGFGCIHQVDNTVI